MYLIEKINNTYINSFFWKFIVWRKDYLDTF